MITARTLFPVTLLASLLVAPLAPARAGDDTAAPTLDALRAHVAELASDELAGREAGSLGEAAAAAYLARSFGEAGLQPGEADGGWFQDTGVRGHALDGLRVVLHTDRGPLALDHGVEYSVIGLGGEGGHLELVVVEGAEQIPDDPSPGQALLLVGSDLRASWMLASRLPEGGAGWGALLLGRDTEEGEAAPLPLHVTATGERPPRLWLRGGALEAARAGRVERVEIDLALGEGRPARNVIGVLPAAEGSPQADEWVIVSAHYDHIGRLPMDPLEPQADRIYNGANDNASGVAVMLTWAHALGAGEPPARNLMFVAFTAEELGLVGSTYFAQNPPVPLEQVVAMVNLEMLGQPDPAVGEGARMFLTGFDRSTLGPAWAEAGVPVVPDPHTSAKLFQRSDNYPLAARGVVAHTLSSGGDTEHYHGLDDELVTLDLEHLTACAREGLAGLRLLADGSLHPRWTAEDGATDADAGAGDHHGEPTDGHGSGHHDGG